MNTNPTQIKCICPSDYFAALVAYLLPNTGVRPPPTLPMPPINSTVVSILSPVIWKHAHILSSTCHTDLLFSNILGVLLTLAHSGWYFALISNTIYMCILHLKLIWFVFLSYKGYKSNYEIFQQCWHIYSHIVVVVNTVLYKEASASLIKSSAVLIGVWLINLLFYKQVIF